MARILHVLPHRGGGAETHIDLLERIEGTEHERVALSAGRTPLKGASSIPVRWPAIAVRARRADVVHVHGDLPAMLALPILARGASVFTTHGLHFSRRHRGVAVRTTMGAVLRRATVTVCTSHAERDELARLNRGRLEVITNGIDAPPLATAAQRAAIRAELGLAPGDLVALYLGQLEARKDPLTAVRAAREAGWIVLVAGEGPEADALGAAGARLLGFRDDPQRLLAAADAFVMPSRHEGLSFAVLEAMGHGLAVLVSDGPGNPEAVGDSGLILPAGDATAWRSALAELRDDPQRRQRLGAAARARAAQHFGADRLVSAMGAVYAQLTGPARDAGGGRA